MTPHPSRGEPLSLAEDQWTPINWTTWHSLSESLASPQAGQRERSFNQLSWYWTAIWGQQKTNIIYSCYYFWDQCYSTLCILFYIVYLDDSALLPCRIGMISEVIVIGIVIGIFINMPLFLLLSLKILSSHLTQKIFALAIFIYSCSMLLQQRMLEFWCMNKECIILLATHGHLKHEVVKQS